MTEITHQTFVTGSETVTLGLLIRCQRVNITKLKHAVIQWITTKKNMECNVEIHS